MIGSNKSERNSVSYINNNSWLQITKIILDKYLKECNWRLLRYLLCSLDSALINFRSFWSLRNIQRIIKGERFNIMENLTAVTLNILFKRLK